MELFVGLYKIWKKRIYRFLQIQEIIFYDFNY